MNKVRKSHPIGLAGGVLSAAGLCLGIFALGKKGEERGTTSQAPPIEPRPEQMLGTEEYLAVGTETKVLQGFEDQLKPSETPATEEPVQPNSGRDIQPSRQTISDLARKGESALAIAQALGISVGEVQLTLKVQGRTACAGHTR